MKIEVAEKIVDKIINDITGRKGIGNEFEMIDTSIQEEIREEWIDIVVRGADE